MRYTQLEEQRNELFSRLTPEVGRLDNLSRNELESYLRSCGVKGIPHTACKCPIANYFHRFLGLTLRSNFHILVTPHAVNLYHAYEKVKVRRAFISKALPSFIYDFDKGSTPVRKSFETDGIGTFSLSDITIPTSHTKENNT